MLIILHSDFKIRDTDKIDSIVCAEIPNKNTHPRLYDVVTTCMTHSPCGALNGNQFSPCLEDGICTKRFPKEFAKATEQNVDGYPIYERKNNGKSFVAKMKNGEGNIDVDNRWIVPYNPYLLLKYECHINVEICSSVKSVKYLYKYIFKGFDSCNVRIHEATVDGGDPRIQISHDEIEQFVDSRYVSPPEAMWRLLENPLHGKSHAVYKLAVHLKTNTRLCSMQAKTPRLLKKTMRLP